MGSSWQQKRVIGSTSSVETQRLYSCGDSRLKTYRRPARTDLSGRKRRRNPKSENEERRMKCGYAAHHLRPVRLVPKALRKAILASIALRGNTRAALRPYLASKQSGRGLWLRYRFLPKTPSIPRPFSSRAVNWAFAAEFLLFAREALLSRAALSAALSQSGYH